MRSTDRLLMASASLGALLTSVLLASPAVAQESVATPPPTTVPAPTAEAAAPGEIVITAQRREQRLVDVPISVSAVSGAMLKQVNITNPTQLVKLIPGITFQDAGAVSLFGIRGISLNDYGDANEAPVAFYVDDVYIGALAATTSQLFDVSRVEVLRGPQGTLFGRNATGGLIQVISNKPTKVFTGSFSVQYGSYNQVIVDGAVGGPITNWLRFRTAGNYNRDDGWQINETTHTRLGKTNKWAVRQLFDADLAPNLTFELNLHGSHANDVNTGYGYRGVLDPVTGDPCSQAAILALQCTNNTGFRDPNPNPRHVYSDLARPRYYTRNFGTSGTFKWHLGDVDVTSITAYEQTKKLYEEDADASPQQEFYVFYNVNRKQFSQELRANGKLGNLRWVLGGYHYQENIGDGVVSVPQLIPLYGTYGLQNVYSAKTRADAAFAQGDYELSPTLTATAGIRFSHENKTLTISDDAINPTYIDHEAVSVSKVTWKAGVNWKFVPNWLAYASVSTGFKSPAFNTTLSLQGGSKPSRPENNTNYEIGVKGESHDHRIQFSSAIFYLNYKNFQLVDIPANSSSPASFLINADGANIYGAEAELNTRPARGLTFNINATYLHTRIKSPGLSLGGFPLDGHRLGRAPTLAVKGLVVYEYNAGTAGKFGARVDANYQTAEQTGLTGLPVERIAPYTLVNAGVNWSPAGSRLRVEAFVDNAFNRTYTVYQYQFADVSALQWGRTRTFGVRGEFHW